MATPEFRWPMTAMMSLSEMMFLALAVPTSGLAGSSTGRARPSRTCVDADRLGQERLELASRLAIARADGERLLEERLGLQRAARPALLRRTRDQGHRVVRGETRKSRLLGESLTVVGQGLGVLALLRDHGAQVGQRPAQVGIEPQGEVEHLLGFLVLVLPVKRSRDITREHGALWAEREGPAEGRFRLSMALLEREGGAEVVPADGVFLLMIRRPP